MFVEILSLLDLAVMVLLGIYIVRDRTETNIALWRHKIKIDDLENRIGRLEKRVSDIEERE